MRLAIADPPYPPMFSERRDLADGGTRLDVLGYDPDEDELVDMFPGSGSVTRAAAQGVIL